MYQGVKYDAVPPNKEMFMQVFKSYDRESQGVLSLAQVRHILETYGKNIICMFNTSSKVNEWKMMKLRRYLSCWGTSMDQSDMKVPLDTF